MKRITHIKCLEPFMLFGIHNGGECYSCCPVWTKVGTVGRLTDQTSMMELWNSEKMQYIRQAILDDQLAKVCNFKYCPYAIKNEYHDLEALKIDDRHFNQVIDRIMAGDTIMDQPPHTLFLANSKKCNLNCIMCDSKHLYPERDEVLDQKLFTQIIPEILPGVSRIFMSGHGEVLLNPYSRKFLQTMDASRYPALKICLLTNGTLFTPEFWKTISHNRYGFISVSVDAATAKTYEKIRRNGNWKILRRNLDLISELRRQNIFETFELNFVVMKSNYQEIKEFAELGLQLGSDRIIFQKMFGLADIRENINYTKNKNVYSEIGKILRDPIFNRREVDTAMIDEYRKYTDKPVTIVDRIWTRIKEGEYYLPIQRYF